MNNISPAQRKTLTAMREGAVIYLTFSIAFSDHGVVYLGKKGSYLPAGKVLTVTFKVLKKMKLVKRRSTLRSGQQVFVITDKGRTALTVEEVE